MKKVDWESVGMCVVSVTLIVIVALSVGMGLSLMIKGWWGMINA